MHRGRLTNAAVLLFGKRPQGFLISSEVKCAHFHGTRVAYEIAKQVVTEAIVNAVAHRDYTSDASVQVMLFADRLEVWNPGTLPPPLTLRKLRIPHQSVPGNPLLARLAADYRSTD